MWRFRQGHLGRCESARLADPAVVAECKPAAPGTDLSSLVLDHGVVADVDLLSERAHAFMLGIAHAKQNGQENWWKWRAKAPHHDRVTRKDFTIARRGK